MVEATVGMIGAAKVISEVSKNEAVRQSVGSWFNKLAAQIKVSTFDVAALSNLFSNYMSSSYERCGYVKTFASEDAPVPISQIYVSPNFSYTHRKIDDYTAMQIILDKKRTIIEATGGMGKTIFMKHFWTKVFHEHNYLIPIFFELKKFTDKETTDFVSFVRIHISGSHMNKEMFAELCEAGALIFFFDGLDEVHSEARQVVEKGIKDIAGRYPKIRIVVTTRPDPQVRGWDTFHVLRPTALTLDQAVSVVDKISFDPEIKKSFISNVKATLYKKHEDFLSNPLLINIMLITFKEFAEIPDKVTVFYEYAFDVLYQRHDAKKDGYLREKKSGLAPDEFKDFFSYFCFSSYASGLTEFRPEEFKTHSAVASKLSGFKVQGDHFRADLIDAVCMLRDEGVSYAFSHRSFQEFFAARAIARLDEERMYKSCIKFISQRASNVVKMFANYDLRRFEFGFAERYLTEKLPEQSLREIDTLSAADAFFDTLERFPRKVNLRDSQITRDVIHH